MRYQVDIRKGYYDDAQDYDVDDNLYYGEEDNIRIHYNQKRSSRSSKKNKEEPNLSESFEIREKKRKAGRHNKFKYGFSYAYDSLVDDMKDFF